MWMLRYPLSAPYRLHNAIGVWPMIRVTGVGAGRAHTNNETDEGGS